MSFYYIKENEPKRLYETFGYTLNIGFIHLEMQEVKIKRKVTSNPQKQVKCIELILGNLMILRLFSLEDISNFPSIFPEA